MAAVTSRNFLNHLEVLPVFVVEAAITMPSILCRHQW